MKATVINKYGVADAVFESAEIPDPVIAPDEVLVKVMATSINPIDYKIRSGHLPHLVTSFPAILHGDVAGVVEQVGRDVTAFKPGDKVYGCIGGFLDLGGALAEFVKATGDLFAKMPDNLSFAQAAALPLVGITGYQAVEKVIIQPGQKILVYGGTGGVGHLIVQLAKLAGAEVYATIADENKAAIVKSLGADYAIDYHIETVEDIIENYTNGKGFDVVFDTVGNENLLNSFQLAKIGGSIVTILALTSLDISLLHEKALNLHVVYMITPLLYNDKAGKEHLGTILSDIAKLVESGKVTPLIDRTFSFDEIAAAHQYAERGNNIGKVVVSH